MKLHLVSELDPAVTSCGRSLQAFGTRVGQATTSQRSLFRRRRNAKPAEVCVWCARVEDADARRERLTAPSTKKKPEQCPVVYAGPSYPEFRGARCIIGHHPHQNVRHYARINDKPLMWWTAEEKEALRA